MALAWVGVTGVPSVSQTTYGVPRSMTTQARSAKWAASTHSAPEVVFAAFHHLGVVGPGELGVLAAGVVGGADQSGAEQSVAGLADGLALAVALPGLGGLGG